MNLAQVALKKAEIFAQQTDSISNRVVFEPPGTLLCSNGLCAKWVEGTEDMELAPTWAMIFLWESAVGEETVGDGKTLFALTPGCRGRVLICGYLVMVRGFTGTDFRVKTNHI